MKRLVLFLAVAWLTTVCALSQKKETRQVADFSGIDASSVFDITVVRGNAETLVIEADDEVMQYVRSEVRNGVLHLYLDNNRVKNIKTLKASVVMKNLDKVHLSGTCKLTSNDTFTSESFEGECSGVSNMSINVNTGRLSIETSGACKIQIKADVSGDADINVSGTSKFNGELKASNVKLSSSGAGKVDLTGSATSLKIDISGTAKINAGNFTVKNAAVNSAGAGNVTVNVTDALTVNSSGTSSVYYKGSPTVTLNSSGASKVKTI